MTGDEVDSCFVCRLVCDHGLSAALCVTAVKILCSVCHSAAIQKDIVRMWTSSEVSLLAVLALEIVYRF